MLIRKFVLFVCISYPLIRWYKSFYTVPLVHCCATTQHVGVITWAPWYYILLLLAACANSSRHSVINFPKGHFFLHMFDVKTSIFFWCSICKLQIFFNIFWVLNQLQNMIAENLLVGSPYNWLIVTSFQTHLPTLPWRLTNTINI